MAVRKTQAKVPWDAKPPKSFGERDNPNQTFYNSAAWRRTSKGYLANNPVCVVCAHLGSASPATVTDHIIPVNQGGCKFDYRNLQALCESHHNQKSRNEKDNPILVALGESFPIDLKLPKNKTDIIHVLTKKNRIG